MVDEAHERSIAWLEKRIETLRLGDKANTKATKAEIKRLQSTLNKTYIEYKRKLMKLEKENKTSLMFLRSTRGFHKLFGNSLYFYAFDIAPKLNIEARVFSDGDFEEKSEAGVVSIRNLDEIERRLGELKIKKANTRDKTGNIVVYKLPWAYTDKEIQRFAGHNTYALHKYNHAIVADNIIPVLYLNLNELMKICYENVRRLETVARDTLGNYLIDNVAEMLRVYIRMASGKVDEELGLLMIREELDEVKAQVKILADLKLWNARTYARVGECLIKIQDITDDKTKQW